MWIWAGQESVGWVSPTFFGWVEGGKQVAKGWPARLKFISARNPTDILMVALLLGFGDF